MYVAMYEEQIVVYLFVTKTSNFFFSLSLSIYLAI